MQARSQILNLCWAFSPIFRIFSYFVTQFCPPDGLMAQHTREPRLWLCQNKQTNKTRQKQNDEQIRNTNIEKLMISKFQKKKFLS